MKYSRFDWNPYFKWFFVCLGIVGIFDWFIFPFLTGAPLGP